MAGRPSGWASLWKYRAAQSRWVRPGEAQRASWGAAKADSLTMLHYPPRTSWIARCLDAYNQGRDEYKQADLAPRVPLPGGDPELCYAMPAAGRETQVRCFFDRSIARRSKVVISANVLWRRLARAPEAVAGIPLAGARPGSAELHGATRRGLRSRAGAPPRGHFDLHQHRPLL